MNKKMKFGVLLTVVGLVLSGLFIIYAAMHPWDWNGIRGLLGSLLGTETVLPFLVSMSAMVTGLVICWKEAYRKDE